MTWMSCLPVLQVASWLCPENHTTTFLSASKVLSNVVMLALWWLGAKVTNGNQCQLLSMAVLFSVNSITTEAQLRRPRVDVATEHANSMACLVS